MVSGFNYVVMVAIVVMTLVGAGLSEPSYVTVPGQPKTRQRVDVAR